MAYASTKIKLYCWQHNAFFNEACVTNGKQLQLNVIAGILTMTHFMRKRGVVVSTITTHSRGSRFEFVPRDFQSFGAFLHRISGRQ